MTVSLALIVFVFSGLFSPGPNVLMLTTSGARFGFRATLPHLLGVPIGTGLNAAASALGVGALLLSMPVLKFTLQCIAALWILWLAYQTARAAKIGKSTSPDRPFRFHEAILFQAINPKVWAITLAASAGFNIGLTPTQEALRLMIVFASINLGVCLFWTSIGHLLSRFLSSDTIWRFFMRIMAILMGSSALLIFL